ncbi:MAG: hypothetical protein BRC25_01625 [Parcubacteria group bacterium SW_6_46_9]|nr:MAG: hypothetical protein BRC25_01625 [Parcubacteria group bacterium SW_6_46_9]
MTSDEFVPLKQAISDLNEKQRKRLNRVTERIEDTKLVNPMINKKTGSLRFVDEEGELLLEREGFLSDH